MHKYTTYYHTADYYIQNDAEKNTIQITITNKFIFYF